MYFTVHQFLFSMDIDNINLYDLLQYIEEESLATKIHYSYKSAHSSLNVAETMSINIYISYAARFVEFLKKLTFPSAQGRIELTPTHFKVHKS